jgi:hypothetical protein
MAGIYFLQVRASTGSAGGGSKGVRGTAACRSGRQPLLWPSRPATCVIRASTGRAHGCLSVILKLRAVPSHRFLSAVTMLQRTTKSTSDRFLRLRPLKPSRARSAGLFFFLQGDASEKENFATPNWPGSPEQPVGRWTTKSSMVPAARVARARRKRRAAQGEFCFCGACSQQKAPPHTHARRLFGALSRGGWYQHATGGLRRVRA